MVSSAGGGQIEVGWVAPVEGAVDFRVSWGLESVGLTSWRAENSAVGGNAYPGGDAVSYIVEGLDAGSYRVWVRARYDDFANGAWVESDTVSVSAVPVVSVPVVSVPVVSVPVVSVPGGVCSGGVCSGGVCSGGVCSGGV